MTGSDDTVERLKAFLSPGPGEGGDPPDALFGRIAQRKGYVTEVQLDECLREQKRLCEGGEALRIGQILFRKGYLTTTQLLDVLSVHRQGLRVCPACGRVLDVSASPRDAVVRCPDCGADAGGTGGDGGADRESLPRLGKYRLLREVGRGGMAVVYEAEDPELKRRVALKVLRDADVRSTIVHRLHREAAIAARLQHPNIVGIHEVGMVRDAAGRPAHFIAMDYVEGRTLADLLKEGRIPLPEHLRILEETARAVGYAHAKGVVHRDLKPGNVMVEAGGRVLLTDFGLAHAEQFETKLTRSHAVMGTPQYMAPEQVEGRMKEIDGRTDVYALGVILYEMLTGRLPFAAETPVHLYEKILREEPERPTQLKKSLDRDLEVICLKAMERERSRRYATAEEFGEDLARFRRGEPIQAHAPSLVYRLRKGIRRRQPVVLSAVGAVLLAALLWWVGAGVKEGREIREALQRESELRKEGKPEDALRQLEWVLGRDPSHEAARSARDEILAELRAAEEGRQKREHLEKEAAERLDIAGSLLDRTVARLYVESADPAEVILQVREARTIIDEALSKAPRMARAHQLLARTKEMEGLWEEAERDLREAVACDREYAPAHYDLGRVLWIRIYLLNFAYTRSQHATHQASSRRLIEEAVKHLEEAVSRLGVTDHEISLAVSRVMRAYLTDAKSVRDLARQTLERFQDNPLRPGLEDIHLVEALASPDRKAVEFCTRALRIRPHYGLARFVRGAHRMKVGEIPGAVEDFTAAVRLHPRFVEAFLNRGVMLVYQQKFEEALGDFEEAIRLQPGSAQGYINRAGVRHAYGDREAALKDFEAALRIDPRIVEVYVNRSLLRKELEDFPGALEDCATALGLDPGCADAHINRGLVREEMKDLGAAIEDYSDALRVDPKNGRAYLSRALLRKKLDDPVGALADLEEAIRFSPKGTPIRRSAEEERARLLRERGEE